MINRLTALRLGFCVATFASAAALISVGHAAPMLSAPPTQLPGNGLIYHTHTVGAGSADSKPDNIAEASDLLSGSPGGFVIGQSFDLTAPYINHGDGDYGGAAAAAQRIIDAGTAAGSDAFASEYFGYINIAKDGTYAFRAFHDDGFRLTLGGDVVASFDSNTAPTSTVVELTLDAGLYSLHFLGWEQGSLFINELSWKTDPSAADFTLIPTSVLFRTLPTPGTVPEPGSVALLGSVLLLLTWLSRQGRGVGRGELKRAGKFY
ncbi:MAG: PEP-CTERM sorting domain-containing protein [Betaproteobacteria bacterium]|nr:PEP-CTERM sorting domain-containing protein [Betaproteobacteria bacterium]